MTKADMMRGVDDYLSSQVNYGGEWVKIGRLMLDLGHDTAARWLQGYAAGGGEIRKEVANA